MSMKAPIEAMDTAIAVVTAAMLRRGKMLHHASLFMSGAVIAFLLFQGAPARWPQGGVLVFGLAEFWCALRVAIDAEFFDLMATDRLSRLQFDAAMLRLGLATPDKSGRDMALRARGAFRLLWLQSLCLLAQIVFLVISR